ncbi:MULTISPECIES: hypothetical protein [unclassified Microcoleus]|uniref:hypothetical protein n=1 Tax=unclassified Microcoleus TaxID=2642155 RepID=UPI002FD3C31C
MNRVSNRRAAAPTPYYSFAIASDSLSALVSRSPPNPNPVGEYSNWSSDMRYRSPQFPNPPIPQSKI